MGIAYNKSTIQQFDRQLKMRMKALPVLRGKEAALRKATKEKEAIHIEYKKEFNQLFQNMKQHDSLWMEYPEHLKISKIKTSTINVAGIQLEEIDEVIFDLAEFSLFLPGIWIASGIEQLKELCRIRIKLYFNEKQIEALHIARRKTTQKVNLYEKVQVPFYQDSIRKIKRFLEDKENIATAAKKLAKARHQNQAS